MANPTLPAKLKKLEDIIEALPAACLVGTRAGPIAKNLQPKLSTNEAPVFPLAEEGVYYSFNKPWERAWHLVPGKDRSTLYALVSRGKHGLPLAHQWAAHYASIAKSPGDRDMIELRVDQLLVLIEEATAAGFPQKVIAEDSATDSEEPPTERKTKSGTKKAKQDEGNGGRKAKQDEQNGGRKPDTVAKKSAAPTPATDAQKHALSQALLLMGLAKKLPKNIPVGTAKDTIYTVVQSIPSRFGSEAAWDSFSSIVSGVFGAELADEHRRPANLRRGPLGMDQFANYLVSAVKDGHLHWEAAVVQLDRLVKAMNDVIVLPPDAPRASKKVLDVDSDDDFDYQPPKTRVEPPSPPRAGAVYDEDGEEITELTEEGQRAAQRKAASKAKAKGNAAPVGKKKSSSGGTKRKAASVEEVSDDESDDDSAIRRAEKEAESTAKSRRGPENVSRKFFKTPMPVIVGSGMNKEMKWVFECLTCPAIRRFSRTVIDGEFDDEPQIPVITNLATHVTQCKGLKAQREKEAQDVEDPDAPLKAFNTSEARKVMDKFLLNGELNPAIVATKKGFLRLFSAWIIDEGLAWTTGESLTLAMLFKYLKIKFVLPSDTTVRNQLAYIFAELHGKIVRELNAITSKISYMTDTWTNRQMIFTFACTMASFIDEDWNLIERVVDFQALEENEHAGILGGAAFVRSARDVGGLSKMSLFSHLHCSHLTSLYFQSLTADNASVNDVICETVARILLAKYQVNWQPDAQIRCMAHVVNLVVQDLLHALDEADDNSETNDWYELHKHLPVFYDPEEDDEQLQMEQEGDAIDVDDDDDDDDESSAPDDLLGTVDPDSETAIVADLLNKSPLVRLRFICTKIVSSPKRRKAYRRIAKPIYKLKTNGPTGRPLATLMPIRDVRTRWYSTEVAITRNLILQEGITAWVQEHKQYRALALSGREWAFLAELCKLLEIFTEVIKQMSHAFMPTVPFVLPLYLKMKNSLEAYSENVSNSLNLRRATVVARAKLEKYHAIARDNHNYHMGTMLHPALRSRWFANNARGGDRLDQQAEIDKAETLFRHIAKSAYNVLDGVPVSESATAVPALVPSSSSFDSFLLDACAFTMPSDTAATPTSQETLEGEIKRYFNFEGAACTLKDPLGWWKSHAASFPRVARMARDYLAIPATSVSVERTFSKSRHICTDLRSSLKADTIRQALLTKTWIRAGLLDLIHPDDHPRKKFKRSDGSAQASA